MAFAVLEPGLRDGLARPPAQTPPRVSPRVCLKGFTSGPQQRRARLPRTLPEGLDPREAQAHREQGLWELQVSAQGGLGAKHTGRSSRGRCWAWREHKTDSHHHGGGGGVGVGWGGGCV